jgi:putative flippase GtrA
VIPSTIAVFMRYAAAGAVGTLVHYAVLLWLVEVRHVPPTLGTTFGFATGAGVNYALNHRLTFQSAQKHHIALTKFLTVAALGLLVNASIVTIGVRWLRVHYFVCQVAATGTVLLLTFLLNRAWTFREGAHDRTAK